MAIENYMNYSHNGKGFLNGQNDPATTNFKDMALAALQTGALQAIGGLPAAGINLGKVGLEYMIDKNQYRQERADTQKFMELQQKMQQENQFMAPQNQVLGMQAAGMNPAGSQFTQATPSQPMGTAPDHNMPNLGNVFEGLADIIKAAKAPSEISQTEAQTKLTEAQTGKTEEESKNIQYDYTTLKPEQVKKMEKDITLLNEQIQSAKNFNDVYQTKSDFIKEHSKNVFSGWRDQLKTSGQWDKLPKKTAESIDALANGDIELDVGSLEALNEIIKTQENLSEADKNVMQNLVGTTVALKQLKDKKITDKLAKLTSAQYDKLYKEMNLVDEKITNQKIKNWSDIVNDKNFMVTKELWKELVAVEGLEQAEKTMDDVHETIRDLRRRLLFGGGGKNPKPNNKSGKGPKSKTTTFDFGE